MAKVAFSKLEAKVNTHLNTISFVNSKGEEISYEVKYYLPIEEKLTMISNIINQSIDDNGYYNPMRLQLYTVLEVVFAYTNLSFTEKQKENPFKLYDQLISSGIFSTVKNNILEDDWIEIEKGTVAVIDNIYKYKNSAMGILEMITSDYSELNLDAQNIQHALGDPENLTLLKDVMTKLG